MESFHRYYNLYLSENKQVFLRRCLTKLWDAINFWIMTDRAQRCVSENRASKTRNLDLRRDLIAMKYTERIAFST